MSLIDVLRKKLSKHVWTATHGDYEFFQEAISTFADAVQYRQLVPGLNPQVFAIAALAAAKRATREQRRECVEFMVKVVYPHCDDETAVLLDGLRQEIEAKDWTIRDALAEERRLSAIDEELAHALSKHDSDVFRRRYPDLFP
jgi:hypothetical protein